MPDLKLLLPFLGLALVACTTTKNPATLSPEHPIPVPEAEEGVPADWARAQLAWEWEYPAPLVHAYEDNREAGNCLELMALTARGYEARNLFEQPFLQARTTLCQAVRASANLAGFDRSFLEPSLLDRNLPVEAPAEFALAISGDTQRRAQARETWAEVETPAGFEPVSNYEAVYRGQDGSVQRLRVLARGDYNGDGLEDAILYLTEGVDGGSYAHARYLIVTRLAQDAPLSLLSPVTDDQEAISNSSTSSDSTTLAPSASPV
ncbi:hypothetical protein ACJO2E_17100 [Marinobacter sp. M1N3S26]|uniref:hypothetical protein n=1 Tax=unclassified Marinobacter TaxID=83889 RepID=UPI00387AD1A5